MDSVTKMFACAELVSRRFLWESKEPLEYLLGRGFTEETLREWGFGYWRPIDTVKVLESLGVSTELMNEACVDDRMAGRITIPLRRPSGDVMGFVARKLPLDEHPVRYVYPSKSVFIEHRSILMGIDKLRSWGRIIPIPVEGPFDLIMSHQNGIPAVCTLRGSFTREQSLMIRALNSEECVFLPDADQWEKNDENNYMKSIAKWRRDLPDRVRIARLSESDPADLLKSSDGREAIMKALREAEVVR